MVRSAVPNFFLPLYAQGLHAYMQILCAFLDALQGGMVVQSPHRHNTQDRRLRTTPSRRKS
jgi:hypothetical protein